MAQVIDQLRRLSDDAWRYAADAEPNDLGGGARRRAEAERTYVMLTHEQLANELEGLCTACWMTVAAAERTWLH